MAGHLDVGYIALTYGSGDCVLSRLGEYLAEITDEPTTRTGFVLFVALLAGFVEYVVHNLIQIVPWPAESRSMADSIVVGLVIGVITYVEVKAVQARRRKIMQQVESVVALNHHVRNALQAIQYAARMPANNEQVVIIDDSIERIDQTLKDLYPIISSARVISARPKAASAGDSQQFPR